MAGHTTLNQALIHRQTGENLSVYCTLDMVKVYVHTLFPKVDATSLLEDETGVWRYRLSIGVLGAVARLIARGQWPSDSGQLCTGLAESMKTLFSAPSTESSTNPAAQPAPPSPALADVIPSTPTTEGNKKAVAKKQLRVQAPDDDLRPADKWSTFRSRNINLGRTLEWLRNKYGSFVTDPIGVAKALSDHWSGMSREGAGTPEQCEAYMQLLPIPTSLKRLAPALFQPLSMDLVQEALKRQVPGASPSIDVFALNIYQEFHEFFSPHMLDILRHAQEDGLFPEAWNKGIIRCIPKTAGASTFEKLRPIALQQLKKNWFMTALLIQVEDILRQITPPPQQVGCIKHRQIQHHIWGVR